MNAFPARNLTGVFVEGVPLTDARAPKQRAEKRTELSVRIAQGPRRLRVQALWLLVEIGLEGVQTLPVCRRKRITSFGAPSVRLQLNPKTVEPVGAHLCTRTGTRREEGTRRERRGPSRSRGQTSPGRTRRTSAARRKCNPPPPRR